MPAAAAGCARRYRGASSPIVRPSVCGPRWLPGRPRRMPLTTGPLSVTRARARTHKHKALAHTGVGEYPRALTCAHGQNVQHTLPWRRAAAACCCSRSWGTLCAAAVLGFRCHQRVISASSHQRFYSVSPKSLYASYQPAPGPWRSLSHGTGRRPTPPPGEISESPIWAGHALRGLYNF